ncbi:MAG: hypothetical protein BMS9Abin37_2053 [Acidobacteriota bacterium]|nr:MAG: hypothetical protein BMS9Abin37_2053 [Acidobacteriota bacterium]
MKKTVSGVLALVVVLAVPAVAQESDVSFVAAIKGSRYDQPHDGEPELTRYFFFTEIFRAEGGVVTDATLQKVGSPSDPAQDPPWHFETRGDVLTFAGGYFPSVSELDAAFPDGRYQLDLDSPSGRLSAQKIEFAPIPAFRSEPVERRAGPEAELERSQYRVPQPVTISLAQDGHSVAPSRVDPDNELTVRWSDFVQGRADPNGIVDDLIFVILNDCHKEVVSHSGRPFAGTPFLTYEAESYSVPKGSLVPGLPYTIVVEHASVVNSDQSQGVAVFASYATVTYLEFHTSGAATDDTCPVADEK